MPFRPSRRQLIAGMASAGILISGRHAFGQFIRPFIQDVAPLPIAIPDFAAGTPAAGEVGAGVAQVITNNLKRSGLFAPIATAALIEKVVSVDAPPQFASWKA